MPWLGPATLDFPHQFLGQDLDHSSTKGVVGPPKHVADFHR
jgi:hypothetical protein